jgi:CHASE2 domain-containing sensor protein
MKLKMFTSQLLDGAPTKAVSNFLFVFATDLSFLVPVLIFSGILLRKKSPWGVITAAMIMLKGVLYPLVLIIGGGLAYLRVGVWDTFIPLYAVLWILCIYFYVRLMKSIKA